MRQQVTFRQQPTTSNKKSYLVALAICGLVALSFFAVAPYMIGEARKAGEVYEAERAARAAELRLRDAEIEQKASFLIRGSDEYGLHKQAFLAAAVKLLSSGRCAEKDFADAMGWTRSINANKTTYFVYCGEMKLENRIHLNAATGKIYQ